MSGRREGRGNFSWADGQSYEGQWVGGRREGEGFFAWNNGERYRRRTTVDIQLWQDVGHKQKVA